MHLDWKLAGHFIYSYAFLVMLLPFPSTKSRELSPCFAFCTLGLFLVHPNTSVLAFGVLMHQSPRGGRADSKLASPPCVLSQAESSSQQKLTR